jgi:hypothetical protein
MNYRSLFAILMLIAAVIFTSETLIASGNKGASYARVRTVPKETKDQKERKKTEQKAASTKELTTSTASLVSPVNSGSQLEAKACTFSYCDPAEKIFAQGLAK